MGFFAAWPIWQKLVFILGCAIVVTVSLGCSKLCYMHWKSSTLPEKERIAQALQRQMSQRRRAGSDVPFGIRAIESGIEVEGVWISRPATPEAIRDSSVASSSKWEHEPRKDFDIDIESQRTGTDHGRAALGSTLARSVSADQASSKRTSRDSSPDFHKIKTSRSKHPPLAYSKYTGNPALKQGSVIGTLEGLEAIHKASGPMNGGRAFQPGIGEEGLASSESSNKSGTDSDPISTSAPRLLNSQRTRQQSADLDLRRMSQAAETGQLTPRVRRQDSADYFYQPRRHSPPPLNAGQYSPNSSSPSRPWSSHLDSLPPAVRRSSLPDVTPFTEFCLTAPASPLSRPASSAGSISSVSSSSSGSRPSAGERSSRSLPLAMPMIAKLSSVQTVVPAPTLFERRDSKILRGHGTGFEILQPGTFPAHTTNSKQHGAPPISLLNSIERTRSHSADRTRRKLQKKNWRPSVGSDTSIQDEVSSIA